MAALAALTIGAVAASPRSLQEGSEQVAPDRGSIVQVERSYRLTLQVPVSREAVYDAWTVAEQLVEWFPDWVDNMRVAPGGGYEMGWEGYDAVWSGEYVEVERPEVLSFTWAPPESIFPAGAYPTTVRVTLEEEEDGTRILLEHSGFRHTREMEPTLRAWRSYLFNLRAYLLQRQARGEI